MIAFEIRVNGHHIETISVGESGMLTAEVFWARILGNDGTIYEEFQLWPRGFEGTEGDSVQWQDANLTVGDAVTIRIVDRDGAGDAPIGRMSREELRARAKRGRIRPE
jgi:hypothetical protein